MDTAADSLTTAATLFAGPGTTNTTPSTNVREFSSLNLLHFCGE